MKIVKRLPKDLIETTKCIGCGEKDPFHYTGTIITGISKGFGSVMGTAPITVSGILESYDRSYPIIVGGEPELKRVGWRNLIKKKGTICRKCAADYRTIEFNGKDVPVVQVDSEHLRNKTIPVERVLAVEPGESLSSTPAKVPVRTPQVPENHWLDVGKDNRQKRRASGKYERFR